ncbi:hypothetical protein [Streptomyces spororaveus]|uniref:hypothetical protein n=1 Tax=Streptomyces spororaveus TaxID=284039 RepID=UPI001922E497|nr:hypothetical protein [Streptomyces spororaveus]
MARDQAEIEQKYRQCLESFVVRARRVAEQSLAGDWGKLVALIDPKIGVRFENGEIRIRHELPAARGGAWTAGERSLGGSCHADDVAREEAARLQAAAPPEPEHDQGRPRRLFGRHS